MVRFRRGAPQAQYRLLTSAVALALLTTACGSTVQVSGQVTGSPGNLGSGESAGQLPGDSGWSGTSTRAAGATTPTANVPEVPGAGGPGQAHDPLALESGPTLPRNLFNSGKVL